MVMSCFLNTPTLKLCDHAGTKAFKKMVTDKAEVDGLPKSALALAAQQAGAELKKVCTPVASLLAMSH